MWSNEFLVVGLLGDEYSVVAAIVLVGGGGVGGAGLACGGGAGAQSHAWLISGHRGCGRVGVTAIAEGAHHLKVKQNQKKNKNKAKSTKQLKNILPAAQGRLWRCACVGSVGRNFPH